MEDDFFEFESIKTIVGIWQMRVLHVFNCQRRGVGCFDWCYHWWHEPLKSAQFNNFFPVPVPPMDILV